MEFCAALCYVESLKMELFEIFRLHLVALKMTALQVEEFLNT